MRVHASASLFLYSSDELPPVDVEEGFLKVFTEEHWANGIVSSASDRNSTITGGSGVKMAGPVSS
jgi:hypothetical protein